MKALACDPVSAFGGVLAFNRSRSTRRRRRKWRNFSWNALWRRDTNPRRCEKFAAKKNLRLLEMPSRADAAAELELKRISGGVLVQEPDRHELDRSGSEGCDASARRRRGNARAAVSRGKFAST